MSNNYPAQLAPKLTYKRAVKLKATVEDSDPLDPDGVRGSGRIFTGRGKYMTLAARDLESHLYKLGLGEMVWIGTYWHGDRQEHQQNMACRITPLGREMAAYVSEHWDGLAWTNSATPTTSKLSGVWGSSSNDVWAVGDALIHHP